MQLKHELNFHYLKQAHEITWGRGMGCDFAKKSCKELMEDKVMQYPFCNDIMSSRSVESGLAFDLLVIF